MENIILEHKENEDVETLKPKESVPQEHLNNKHEAQIKKSLKKKINTKNKSNKSVKRKRIQTFDSSDDEKDSEEEGSVEHFHNLYNQYYSIR